MSEEALGEGRPQSAPVPTGHLYGRAEIEQSGLCFLFLTKVSLFPLVMLCLPSTGAVLVLGKSVMA